MHILMETAVPKVSPNFGSYVILFKINDFAAQILFNVEGKHKIRLVPLAENRALLKLSFNSEREAAPESKGS